MTVRDTPTTYSAEEAEQITRAARAGEWPINCPRCNRPLESMQPVRRRGRDIQEYACPECHRCVMVHRPKA
jgi:transposase-like protein